MATINYIIKVEDAKMSQIKKALEAADIKVVSIIDIFKSGDAAKKDEIPSAEKKTA